jgi:hypothetical protein
MIRKMLTEFVAATVVFLFSTSCTTTSGTLSKSKNKKSVNSEKTIENTVNNEEPPLKQKSSAAPSQSASFISKITDIDMKLISAPKEAVKKKAFPSPYVVTVTTTDGQPVADFPVTVSWPSSRMNDTIIYTNEPLKTDKNGTLSFQPAAATYSFNDKVTFYPTPINSDATVIQAAYNAGVSAPWKVRTDYVGKTGLLYVFDFDKNGKVLTNSMNLLKFLRNEGLNIGNSPISSPLYLSKQVSVLYKDTKAIVGNSFAVMISGTIKFTAPVSESDGMYTCTLISDIICTNMADGLPLYTTQQTCSATAKSEYQSVKECQIKIAEQTAHAILYGM